MNLDEIRNSVNFRLNKDNTGLTLPSRQFNTILQVVNLEFFKLAYGLPEEYDKNAPFARRAYEVSQRMTDDLNPFLVSLDGRDKGYLPVDNRGVAVIPSDYAHVTAVGYDTQSDVPKRIIIEIMTNAQWDSRMGSRIIKPSLKNPICKFHSKKLLLFPYDIGPIAFSYLRYPKKPVYAVIEDPATETEVYDPTMSVELEWPQDVHTDIVNMIVWYASENLGDQLRIQTASQRKKQGV
jgi:hypothetical protein